jgi:hypothetical protein
VWDEINYTLGNRGLEIEFLNCVSMTNIDLARDITYNGSIINYATGAFAGCRSLLTVNLRDYFSLPQVGIASHMFEGCNSLTTISGVIDIRGMDLPERNAKDMFKGCNNLQSVTIICTNQNNNEYYNNLTGRTFITGRYLYEEMGLTTWQMSNVVNLDVRATISA